VTSVLKTHLLPDIIGNMNAYTSQEFRCKSCGAMFRRIPLTGVCLSCNGNLLPTVTRGSVEKYVELASGLFARFKTDEYLRKRFEVINQGLSTLFPPKENRTQDLTRYFEDVSAS
jgi:DNA polymerase II large subunit